MGMEEVPNNFTMGQSLLVDLPSKEAIHEPLIQDAYGPYHCCQDRMIGQRSMK